MKSQVSIVALLGMVVSLVQPAWSMEEDTHPHQQKRKRGETKGKSLKKPRTQRGSASIDNSERGSKRKARKTFKTNASSKKGKTTPGIPFTQEDDEGVNLLMGLQSQKWTEASTHDTPLTNSDSVLEGEKEKEVKTPLQRLEEAAYHGEILAQRHLDLLFQRQRFEKDQETQRKLEAPLGQRIASSSLPIPAVMNQPWIAHQAPQKPVRQALSLYQWPFPQGGRIMTQEVTVDGAATQNPSPAHPRSLSREEI